MIVALENRPGKILGTLGDVPVVAHGHFEHAEFWWFKKCIDRFRGKTATSEHLQTALGVDYSVAPIKNRLEIVRRVPLK